MVVGGREERRGKWREGREEVRKGGRGEGVGRWVGGEEGEGRGSDTVLMIYLCQ